VTRVAAKSPIPKRSCRQLGPFRVGSGHPRPVPIELCPANFRQAAVSAGAASVAIELRSNWDKRIRVPGPCLEPCYPARSMAYPQITM
jgi:hypothetical protein